MWDRRLVQQQLPGCRCSLFWSHVHTVLNLVALFHSPCEQSGVLNMDSGVKNMCRDLPTIKTTHDSSFTFSSSTTNRSERPHPSGDGPELCQIFLLTFVQKQQLQLCNSESSPRSRTEIIVHKQQHDVIMSSNACLLSRSEGGGLCYVLLHLWPLGWQTALPGGLLCDGGLQRYEHLLQSTLDWRDFCVFKKVPDLLCLHTLPFFPTATYSLANHSILCDRIKI